MELLLIRHALPARQSGGDAPADPGLAPDGVEQARRLALYLADERLDAIYTSPMRRARETAEPLLAGRSLELAVANGVAEWDDGGTEYVPLEELKASGDARWIELRDSTFGTTAEDIESCRARVAATIGGLIDRHPSQRIAVVCHGMVINCFLADVLGLTETTAFFAPNYTSIHRVAAARSGERSIVTLNETPHLRGSGLPIGLFQR